MQIKNTNESIFLITFQGIKKPCQKIPLNSICQNNGEYLEGPIFSLYDRLLWVTWYQQQGIIHDLNYQQTFKMDCLLQGQRVPTVLLFIHSIERIMDSCLYKRYKHKMNTNSFF